MGFSKSRGDRGTPFNEATREGRIFADACVEAGLRRSSLNLINFTIDCRDIDSQIREVRRLLRQVRPSVVVALGNEAAHSLVAEWPDGRDRDGLVHRGNVRSARDFENRRGYVFDSDVDGVDAPVIVSVHPAYVASTWSPWRVLLSFDLQRAKELDRAGLRRPVREVHIVSSYRDARQCVTELRRHRELAADIETWSDTSLACIGFAGESGRAIVFPAQYLDGACEVLRRPDLSTIWANGIYDLFVLRHRYGVEFGGRVEDAQILWHACYPELAGAKESKKKHRFTRKSLSFLASLSTFDEWWKGDYATTEEFFIYNGKDCAITLDVWEWVKKEADKAGAWETYEHERSLMWPCVDMLQRGLNVDDDLRRERIEALTSRFDVVEADAQVALTPLLEREKERLEELGRLDLFQETDPTCECCGHGKKKQLACWGCVGFEKPPSKRELLDYAATEHLVMFSKISKPELEERFLPVCHVCGGAPRETRWSVNPNSETQMKVILYELLRLPKKFKRNAKGESVLTVDEASLKSLLGGIPT